MTGAASEEVALATSRLGAFRVALPLQQVTCLAAFDELRPAEETCLDLGSLLGLPALRQGRRVAGLAGGGALYLLLGEAVGVRPVPLSAVHALPALLGAAAARFGCAGLVREDDGFSFLLDAERLRQVARSH